MVEVFAVRNTFLMVYSNDFYPINSVGIRRNSARFRYLLVSVREYSTTTSFPFFCDMGDRQQKSLNNNSIP